MRFTPSSSLRTRGQVSTALVIVLVLILVAAAVFVGYTYRPASTTVIVATSTAQGTTPVVTSTSTTQTATNVQGGFSISYPPGFTTDNSSSVTPSTDWNSNTQTPGVLAFTLTVPQTFEPQTNFSEAKLTVGYSADSAAVKNCYVPLPSAVTAKTSTTTINGVDFQVSTGNDAGAGNLYDTTSYRTVHAGKCYVVEYTIHSTQLANYPASMHLTAFDESKVQNALDNVVRTFAFN